MESIICTPQTVPMGQKFNANISFPSGKLGAPKKLGRSGPEKMLGPFLMIKYARLMF